MNSVLDCDVIGRDVMGRNGLKFCTPGSHARSEPAFAAPARSVPAWASACQLNPNTSGKTATTNNAHAEKTGR